MLEHLNELKLSSEIENKWNSSFLYGKVTLNKYVTKCTKRNNIFENSSTYYTFNQFLF